MIETLLAYALSPLGKAIGALLFGGALLGGAYELGRHDKAVEINGKLAAGKVTILQDGKEIDEKVLAGDDDYLCVVLGGC